MSRFDWSFRRIAYSRRLRESQEEYGGWWRHVAFGMFVYCRKARPGWSADTAEKPEGRA